MANQLPRNTDHVPEAKVAGYNLLSDWYSEYRREQSVFYLSSRMFRTIHLLLGLVTIVCGVVIGSNFLGPGDELLMGIAGSVAAVSSGINTFLKPLQIAERFSHAGRQCKFVRQDIELMTRTIKFSDRDLDRINKRIQSFLKEAPSAPKFIWARVRKRGW